MRWARSAGPIVTTPPPSPRSGRSRIGRSAAAEAGKGVDPRLYHVRERLGARRRPWHQQRPRPPHLALASRLEVIYGALHQPGGALLRGRVAVDELPIALQAVPHSPVGLL